MARYFFTSFQFSIFFNSINTEIAFFTSFSKGLNPISTPCFFKCFRIFSLPIGIECQALFRPFRSSNVISFVSTSSLFISDGASMVSISVSKSQFSLFATFLMRLNFSRFSFRFLKHRLLNNGDELSSFSQLIFNASTHALFEFFEGILKYKGAKSEASSFEQIISIAACFSEIISADF